MFNFLKKKKEHGPLCSVKEFYRYVKEHRTKSTATLVKDLLPHAKSGTRAPFLADLVETTKALIKSSEAK